MQKKLSLQNIEIQSFVTGVVNNPFTVTNPDTAAISDIGKPGTCDPHMCGAGASVVTCPVGSEATCYFTCGETVGATCGATCGPKCLTVATCGEATCGGGTCGEATCGATCGGTCGGATCGITCIITCNTCGATCNTCNTCGHTCNHTCQGTCCNTCGATCANTCMYTCDVNVCPTATAFDKPTGGRPYCPSPTTIIKYCPA